jgi:hypothetical protein
VLDESPGSVIKPPAPVPPASDFLDSAQDFVDDVLPLVAQERAAYQRREARLAKQEGSG